jgi:hypothetical protein
MGGLRNFDYAENLGGPGRTRTYNQQIMSQGTDSDNKENPALPSADSGKVRQNPQPPRNKIPNCDAPLGAATPDNPCNAGRAVADSGERLPKKGGVRRP